MNQKDIKELALRVAKGVSEDSWLCGEDSVIDFAQRFLAAYFAEQKPVARVVFDTKTNAKGVVVHKSNPQLFGNGVDLNQFEDNTQLFTTPPPPEPAPHEQKPQSGTGCGSQTSQCEVKSSSKSHVGAAPEEVRELV